MTILGKRSRRLRSVYIVPTASLNRQLRHAERNLTRAKVNVGKASNRSEAARQGWVTRRARRGQSHRDEGLPANVRLTKCPAEFRSC